jgi:RNA-binding protein
MQITPAQKRALRSRAHHLKPVVSVGQHGLGENVMHEIDCALEAHELVKIKLGNADRDAKRRLLEEIVAATASELVQTIGHVAVLFRRNRKKPRIVLP